MTRRPPFLPRAALRLVVPPEKFEAIDGDLNELFQERLQESGVWRARLRYWHDAASFVGHSYVLRRPAPTPRAQRKGMNTMIFDALNELKHASRVLAARPGYASVAMLTLALGIGANVAIFTVVNAVLLRPLPYPEPNGIVEIRHHMPGLNMEQVQSSAGLIAQYRRNARTLSSVAGFDMRELNLSAAGSPERVRAVAVTPELFTVLGTAPAIGRAIVESDAQKNAAPVAILTHAFWQSRFGGDPAAVGRTVQLDGRSVEVVGVMPRQFVFPDPQTRLIVPLWLDPHAGFGAFGISSLARVAPNATLDAARREIEQLQQRLPEWFPGITENDLSGFGWSVSTERLRDREVAGVSTTLWVLFGTVGFVLLIAGANVANLFLVRAESRQRELAVRSALGASRSRIAGTFLAESLVLAIGGGLAGLLIADGATSLLVAYGPANLPRLQEVHIDSNVLLFAIALSLLSALTLGVLATLTVSRRPFTTLVRDGRGSTAGRSRHRLRRLLIVTQVATAVVLLVGSGLMLRSVARLNAVNPGFQADGVVTTGISFGAQRERARAVTFYQRVLEELASLPGVTSVGAASSLPVAPASMKGSNFTVRSRPATQGEIPLFTMYIAVTEGYFETMGIPRIEGRAPTRSDAGQDRPVVWVSETFARQFLGGHAIGEWIQLDERWLEIVGVVGDVKTFGLRENGRAMAYVPVSNASVGLDVMFAAVRTSGPSGALVSSLRAAVDRVDASVPLTTTRTMEDIVRTSTAQTSFAMTLLVIAASIALLLGVVGLYGVISYIVSERASEIGIRLALGANPVEVRAMVLRQGLSVAVAGVAVGIVAALISTRLMASLLFEVSARDPATFAVVPVILTLVSAAATYLPARRAAGIDPMRALRQEG